MRIPGPARLAIVAAGLAPGAAGCGTAPVAPASQAAPVRSVRASASVSAALVWPAPADPMERTVQAGLKPQPKEFLTNHVHAHLDVFVDGTPVRVPSGIGIKID